MKYVLINAQMAFYTGRDRRIPDPRKAAGTADLSFALKLDTPAAAEALRADLEKDGFHFTVITEEEARAREKSVGRGPK